MLAQTAPIVPLVTPMDKRGRVLAVESYPYT